MEIKRLVDSIGNDLSGKDSPDVDEQKRSSKKKVGRRGQWEEKYVNSSMDVVVDCQYFSKNMVFTKNKPQKNKEVYEKVIAKLNEEYVSEFPFSVWINLLFPLVGIFRAGGNMQSCYVILLIFFYAFLSRDDDNPRRVN